MHRSGWSSTASAAERLGVTARTIYSLANAGELVGYKIGRVYRWRNDDIADFLDRHRIRPATSITCWGTMMQKGDASSDQVFAVASHAQPPEMSTREAAAALGESLQLTAWLIDVGRIARPVTLSSIRAYREAETALHSADGRIEPGTLGHLWRPDTRRAARPGSG